MTTFKAIGVPELLLIRLFFAGFFFCFNCKILIFFTTCHSKIVWNYSIIYIISISVILLIASFLELNWKLRFGSFFSHLQSWITKCFCIVSIFGLIICAIFFFIIYRDQYKDILQTKYDYGTCLISNITEFQMDYYQSLTIKANISNGPKIIGCGCISSNKLNSLDENTYWERPNQFFMQNFSLAQDYSKHITGMKIADWSCVDGQYKNKFQEYLLNQKVIPCKVTMRGQYMYAVQNQFCPASTDNFFQVNFDDKQYYDELTFKMLIQLTYIPMILFEIIILLSTVEIFAFSPCIGFELSQDKLFPIMQMMYDYFRKIIFQSHENPYLVNSIQQNDLLNNPMHH